MKDKVNGVTIVICCYNSAIRLQNTLMHIFNLNGNPDHLELIIVNNASTDNTFEVAELEINRYNKKIEFKLLNEDKAGLNNARFMGAKNAKHDWILFCDDDNWLEENYLINFRKNLEHFPNVGILGCGVSEAVFEKTPHEWFKNYQQLCAIFNIKDLDKEYIITKSLNDTCYVCGAGMFIKTELVLNYFGDKNYKLLDRTGDTLNSGGDTDIICYSLNNNHDVGMFCNLKIKHFISTNRIKKTYILKLVFAMSFSNSLIRFKYYDELKKPFETKFILHIINNLIHLNFFIVKYNLSILFGNYKAYKLLKNSQILLT